MSQASSVAQSTANGGDIGTVTNGTPTIVWILGIGAALVAAFLYFRKK